MSLPGPRFTYADYRLMPEDKRYEVIEGELLVTPAPNIRHQMILTRLFLRLATFVEAAGLGQVLPAPTDVILSDENVVQPDLLFVAKERQAILDPEAGGVRGAPDLVVEILSLSTANRDRVTKRKLYARYGVREYWLVDPITLSIEVLVEAPGELETWRLFSAGSTLISPLLSTFSIAVAEIFRE